VEDAQKFDGAWFQEHLFPLLKQSNVSIATSWKR